MITGWKRRPHSARLNSCGPQPFHRVPACVVHKLFSRDPAIYLLRTTLRRSDWRSEEGSSTALNQTTAWRRSGEAHDGETLWLRHRSCVDYCDAMRPCDHRQGSLPSHAFFASYAPRDVSVSTEGHGPSLVNRHAALARRRRLTWTHNPCGRGALVLMGLNPLGSIPLIVLFCTELEFLARHGRQSIHS
jgi:hypothetical protein